MPEIGGTELDDQLSAALADRHVHARPSSRASSWGVVSPPPERTIPPSGSFWIGAAAGAGPTDPAGGSGVATATDEAASETWGRRAGWPLSASATGVVACGATSCAGAAGPAAAPASTTAGVEMVSVTVAAAAFAGVAAGACAAGAAGAGAAGACGPGVVVRDRRLRRRGHLGDGDGRGRHGRQDLPGDGLTGCDLRGDRRPWRA